MKRHWLAAALSLALAACATGGQTPEGPPSLEIAAGLPAPPQARFYADCIAQAAEARTYDREANVLRFRCDGAVAQDFFAALGPWSAEIGSEIAADGAVWRFSSRIERDPSFVDFCRREADATRYSCTVILNIGPFLER